MQLRPRAGRQLFGDQADGGGRQSEAGQGRQGTGPGQDIDVGAVLGGPHPARQEDVEEVG